MIKILTEVKLFAGEKTIKEKQPVEKPETPVHVMGEELIYQPLLLNEKMWTLLMRYTVLF